MKDREEMLFFALLAIAALIGFFSYSIKIPAIPVQNINISSCGVLNTPADYNLIKNVSSSLACFKITSMNSVLDCHGFSISGNGQGYGVEVFGNNNIVRNCMLVDFPEGIYISLTSANNTLVDNQMTTAKKLGVLNASSG